MRAEEVRRLSSGIKVAALVLITAIAAWAEPPQEVIQVVSDAADALANNDANIFLDLFDNHMPGFDSLSAEVHYMAGAEDEIDSSVEVVTATGAGQRWDLQLDWVLRFGMETPRRAIIKCRIEKQGRKWKITALTPVDFFKV
jgi:hypothetical protein